MEFTQEVARLIGGLIILDIGLLIYSLHLDRMIEKERNRMREDG